MQRLARTVTNALTRLLKLDPQKQLAASILGVLGTASFTAFVSILSQVITGVVPLQGIRWLGLLTFPVAFAVVFLIVKLDERKTAQRHALPLTSIEHPRSSVGLIIFLGRFTTFKPKLPTEIQHEVWSGEHLLEALKVHTPDWHHIELHIQASNMQPQVEAIRYHHSHGTLRHVWIISTMDSPGKQDGSKHYADAFRKIVERLYTQNDVEIHHWDNDNGLLVTAYNVQDAFKEVDRVFQDETRRRQVKEEETIADITGGTSPMTSGMLLACALLGRQMQFTAADTDPHYGKPLEKPQCYAIQINETELELRFLDRMMERRRVET